MIKKINCTFSDNELLLLIEGGSPAENTPPEALVKSPLFRRADAVRREVYGNAVYARGLIEFSNYCRNNCLYCGLRAENSQIPRYRLTREEIVACCDSAYQNGMRTFVLQSGEDPHFSDHEICGIVSSLKQKFPGCAVTLSVGEKSRESYQSYFDAGADRYLLRHETANGGHYAKLHPSDMTAENRKKCLYDLKEIGYQVGAGLMVGSPYQTPSHLLEDIRFMRALQPDMIGVGPFIPHGQTPFAKFPRGTLNACLRLVAVLRIFFPHALIPATTALGVVHPYGRELALQAGANVVMPNFSPLSTRALYVPYNKKTGVDGEAAANCRRLRESIAGIGYEMVVDVGNVKR
ncbi:MAG: [FeFe] hydrogenase H-cluster radical SAM maturase HydE [Clostridiales bacterium]|jgi:biotin synthase|nr:[FeFe] hydrogenase H-cluster radical SAM maturase HydE [Clostridiales bacterium]